MAAGPWKKSRKRAASWRRSRSTAGDDFHEHVDENHGAGFVEKGAEVRSGPESNGGQIRTRFGDNPSAAASDSIEALNHNLSRPFVQFTLFLVNFLRSFTSGRQLAMLGEKEPGLLDVAEIVDGPAQFHGLIAAVVTIVQVLELLGCQIRPAGQMIE
jgi:hypothetical protein